GGGLGGRSLPGATLRPLGRGATSRRSLFITGPPGTGKTTVARGIHAAITGNYWIPYAIEVEGQVIKMFDAHGHEPVPAGATSYDRRWIRIKRPLVIVGGEMSVAPMI